MKHEATDAERIALMESDIASLKGSVATIDSTLKLINSKLSEIGRPNFALWLTAAGVAVSVFALATGGLFYFMKSEIGNQVMPVSLKAASSEIDRHRLNDQVYRNMADIARVEQTAMVNSISEKERGVERETQNRAMAQFANIRHEQYLRLFGLLWEKEYGQTLPQVNFFPDISFTRPHGN